MCTLVSWNGNDPCAIYTSYLANLHYGFARANVPVTVYMNEHAHACVFTPMHASWFVCVLVYMHVCGVHACLWHACLCVCVRVHVMCGRVCVCMCMPCVCVCVCAGFF